jgi:hypothetical protein
MKSILWFTLILASGCTTRSGTPQVDVVYAAGFDSVCSLLRGYEIKDEWKAELVSRQQEFEDSWEEAGRNMIQATEAITGKPFPSAGVTARLTLCNLPSQSIIGISVNMRRALVSFAASPVPMRYKVDTLFHELLHDFLQEHPVKNSALLAEHASESWRTRNHLHLLALQKAVLLKLGEDDALQDVIAFDGQLPNASYKRAWALVNATDREYLRYIAELSQQ